MTSTTTDLPLLIEEVECVGVERLTPSFVRVELASPALTELGVDGPFYDQRIKLIFPEPGHPLPSFAEVDESWFGTWMDRPIEERGHMRTYTLRELRGEGGSDPAGRRLHRPRGRVRSRRHLGRQRPGRRPAGPDGAASRTPVRRHRVRPR